MGDQESVTVVDPKTIGFPGSNFDSKPYASHAQPHNNPASTAAADHVHRHHESTSTQASESADSSPTTTMSCTDSSSLSDPSPSSSPDSPVNLVPLAAFPGPSFGVFPSMSAGLASLSVDGTSDNINNLRFNNGVSGVGMGLHSSNNAPLQRPMTSPSPRRARNMKGLSIQPPFASPASSTQGSEPTSPSFIKPQIPTMKRKPSQLSLKTSTRELITTTTAELPQSPTTLTMPSITQRRALKHSTSSPHILSSLKSATFGPVGGMSFGTVLERNESGLSEFLRPSKPTAGPVSGYDSTILEEDSPIRTQIASRAAFEFEPFHENENNEDQKTPGYPDGPIAIYSDNVYLYLEPTAEEAARFDVVINVAREVKNPFKAGPKTQTPPPAPEEQTQALPQLRRESAAAVPALAPVMEHEPEAAEEYDNNGTVPMIIEPAQTEPTQSKLKLKAPPMLSLTRADATESEASTEELGTPTTPKASGPKEPEYIHMPWDHNTDISQDLIMLCEKIERKTKDGKKVLIHCQQGASRSASLIIAYGIWQNPDLSVNDAYYAAQSKSRWISPNMRLMYCLQDFQKEMGKRRQPTSSALRPRSGRSPTKHRVALSVDAIDLPKEPLSAPLPAEDNDGKNRNNTLSPERSPMRPRGNSTPQSRDGISPGPSSAPSAFSWNIPEDVQDPQRFGRFDFGFSSTVEPPEPSRATEAPQMSFPMKLGQAPKLEPLPSGLRPSALAWPGSESSSFGKPPPSPGMFPNSQAWPGSESMSFGKPPPSPAMFPSSQAWPSSETEAFGKPKSAAPPSLGLGLRPNLQPVESNSKPPPSPGLRPMTLSLPGRGSDASSKPPPSPGFAAHRFGKFPTDTARSSTASSSSNTNSNTASSVSPSYSPGFPRPRSSCSGGLDSILAQNMSGSASGSGFSSVFPPLKPLSFASMDRSAATSSKPEVHESHTISFRPAYQVEEPLMSPRAETMTNNPLHDNLAGMAGMQFVETAPTPSEGLFSPRESMFPRDPFYPFGRPTQVADPRSPPTKGETPIVRSIDELM